MENFVKCKKCNTYFEKSEANKQEGLCTSCYSKKLQERRMKKLNSKKVDKKKVIKIAMYIMSVITQVWGVYMFGKLFIALYLLLMIDILLLVIYIQNSID